MSKGLDALERLKYTLLAESFWQDVLQDVSIIEEELKVYELLKEDIKKCSCWKEHKALEIIKEICEFKFIEQPDLEDTMYYAVVINIRGCSIGGLFKKIDTKEEYDLLKEVLL